MFKRGRKEIPEKKVMGFHVFNTGAARLTLIVSVLAVMFCLPCFTEEKAPVLKVPPPVLKKAVLCEKVVKEKPVYEGVAFSAGKERLFCYNYFEPVYGEGYIFHKYYFKDVLINPKPKKLSIKPPSFATYSRIDLRESDKGPWRVEITDAEDNILTTIRFSITD